MGPDDARLRTVPWSGLAVAIVIVAGYVTFIAWARGREPPRPAERMWALQQTLPPAAALPAPVVSAADESSERFAESVSWQYSAWSADGWVQLAAVRPMSVEERVIQEFHRSVPGDVLAWYVPTGAERLDGERTWLELRRAADGWER